MWVYFSTVNFMKFKYKLCLIKTEFELTCVLSIKYIPDFGDLVWKKEHKIAYQ